MNLDELPPQLYAAIKKQLAALGIKHGQSIVVSDTDSNRRIIAEKIARIFGLVISENGVPVTMFSQEEYVASGLRALVLGNPLHAPSLLGTLSDEEMRLLCEVCNCTYVTAIDESLPMESLKKYKSLPFATQKSLVELYFAEQKSK